MVKSYCRNYLFAIFLQNLHHHHQQHYSHLSPAGGVIVEGVHAVTRVHRHRRQSPVNLVITIVITNVITIIVNITIFIKIIIIITINFIAEI